MEWLGRLKTTGDEPTSRKGHSMTRLLDSPLILVFGGELGSGTLLNDMYCLNVESRVWRKITYADGPRPVPRLLHTATAISSTALIIMGGDCHFRDATVGPARDVWRFDIRTCSWKEITSAETMPTRSGHTAVFGNSPGQVPAVYVFGGSARGGQEASAVYRLRIGDMRWECLPIVVTNPDGEQDIVEKPTTGGGSRKGNAREEDFPCPREAHAAIWLPALCGMLVIGGDTGHAVTDDCWLFVPSPKHPGAWKWRKLNFTMARGLAHNKLPLCSGMICVSLPTEKTQVLIWGGILGPVGEVTMPPTKAYLLDLDAMHSTCIVAKSAAPEIGRLLHGFVRVGDYLYTFGGCESGGQVLEGLEHARILDKFKCAGLRATDFGREAAEVAALGISSSPVGNGFGFDKPRPERKESDEDEEASDDLPVPLMGPSTIPKGTPLSGRILDETDYGYFVSVVINGKLYKGVLVANPLKQSEVAHEDKVMAVQHEQTSRKIEKAHKEVQKTDQVKSSVDVSDKGQQIRQFGENARKESEDKAVKSPEQKRRRVDPKAAALPDSPPGRKPVEQDEVIDIT